MFTSILAIIANFDERQITDERKMVLQPLVDYLLQKTTTNEPIRLNFICTHNSRRSHLSQIWAQTLAHHVGLTNVYCYSGGTEATALFPKVVETLIGHGFFVQALSAYENPVYVIKYGDDEAPIICFSKKYDHAFNPKSHFAAIMTCNSADEGCPMVVGAEARFPIKYDDPKAFDGTPLQTDKYRERSLEIAQEMWWIFQSVVIQNKSKTNV